MSEIEKMYENCGIYPDCKARECGLDYCANSSGCGYAVYPDFTAEKQLELIKWLGRNKNGFGFFNADTKILSCHCDFHWEWFDKDFYAEDFDNALAGLINSFWHNLTEEEQQQIRGILERN